MADLGKLEIQIGVNDDELKAGLDAATSDVKQYATSVEDILNKALINTQGIMESVADLKPFSPHIDGAVQAAKNVNDLKDLLAQLKIEAAEATTTAEWSAYQKAIQGVEGEIKNLNTMFKQTGAEVKAVVAAEVETAAATNAMSGALNAASKGFSFLRQAAYLIPGIGMAGIIGGIVDVLGELGGALLSATSDTKEFTKAQQDAAKAMNDAKSSAQSEAAQIQALANIAADAAEPYQKRVEAVNQLQEKYPSYLGNLSQEALLAGQATEQIKALNDAILNKALAEAASKNIEKYATELFSLQDQIKKTTKELADAQELAKYPVLTVGNGASSSQVPHIAELQSSLKGLNAQAKEYTDLINQASTDMQGFISNSLRLTSGKKDENAIYAELNKKLDEYNKLQQATGVEQAKNKVSAYKEAIKDLIQAGLDPAGTQIRVLVDMVEHLGGSFDNVIKHAKTAGDQVNEIIAKMKAKIEAIDLNAKGESLFKVDEQKINTYTATIAQLLEKGLKQNAPQVQDILFNVDNLEFEILPEKLRKSFDDFKKNVADKLKTDQAPTEVPILTSSATTLSDVQARAMMIKMRDALKKAGKEVFTTGGISTDVDLLTGPELFKNFDALANDAEARFKQIQDIAKGVGDAITSVFDTLLEKGSISIGDIGKMLEKIIIKLVAATAEAAVFAAIMSAFGGGSFSAIFGAVSGFNSKAFSTAGTSESLIPHADGGGFTGPTLWGNHLIGENGFEALMNTDQIRELAGVGSGNGLNITNRFVIGATQVNMIQRVTSNQVGRSWGTNK